MNNPFRSPVETRQPQSRVLACLNRAAGDLSFGVPMDTREFLHELRNLSGHLNNLDLGAGFVLLLTNDRAHVILPPLGDYEGTPGDVMERMIADAKAREPGDDWIFKTAADIARAHAGEVLGDPVEARR